MTPAGGPMRVADGSANGRSDDAPTQQLSIAAVSDRCVNCGAPLASDQRYCVNCGERRGKPRFTLAGPSESAPELVAVSKTSQTRRPRTTAGFNLIAGIATLLLAMGVGVLIGHNSSSGAPAKSAAAPTVITVGGGSGTASGSSTTNSGSSQGNSGGAKKGKSSSKAAAKAAKAPAKVVVQKAAAAAAKVTGGNANVAGATATQGSSCTNGQAGCQNGKFTGNNFFGQ